MLCTSGGRDWAIYSPVVGQQQEQPSTYAFGERPNSYSKLEQKTDLDEE